MNPSERANLPRWRGQPGFYEIWFFVIFDPSAERAWWLRFTTFAPIAGEALTMQWLAEFDRKRGQPTVAKWIAPARSGYRAESDHFALSFGESELSHGALRGAFATDRHRFAWDLAFVPAARPRQPLPAIFDRLPSPVHVAHVHSGVRFSGRIEVDGRTVALANAPGLQKHIWGRRVVEQLYWLHCSRFESDPDLEVEVTSVRPREKWPPTLAFAEAYRAGKSVLDGNLLRTKLEPSGTYALSASSGPLRIHARCDPDTLVGYKYRDPRGSEVFVAQSDVGDAVVELAGRQIQSLGTTALEFHGKNPLPGVSYIGFEDTG